jgi:hypothetical protein
MKIFYSSFSRSPHVFGGKLSNWIFLFLLLFFVGSSVYGLYWLLRLIFAKSFLLGVLFIFFGFPLIARFLFFVFLVVLPVFLAGVLMASKKEESPKAGDDVVDVKYKIIE